MITFIVTILNNIKHIKRYNMSFSKVFDSMINDFCKELSVKYKLDHSEVYSLWSSQPQQSQSQPQPSQAQSTEKKEDDSSLAITHETISTATKDMLAGMCKKVGLKQSGKKEELYKRLVDHLTASPKTEVVSKKPSSASSSSKKEEAPVIKSVKERTAELAIRKNSHGNFEHVATGLVFNTDKMVYGKQSEDGTVIPLTVDDIEICKKYKFPFKVPENLNTSKNLDDVKVEEMAEEVLEDDDLEDDIVDDEEDLGGEDEN